MTQVYHYHPITKEFISESVADLDPIEGKPLYPRYSTGIVPPITSLNQAAIFEEGIWTIVPDFRKQEFWIDHYTSITIKQLGEVPDPTWVKERPPKPEADEIAELINEHTKALFDEELYNFIYNRIAPKITKLTNLNKQQLKKLDRNTL